MQVSHRACHVARDAAGHRPLELSLDGQGGRRQPLDHPAHLDAHGLQPYRVTTFKLSKDPAFVEKLTDVVGLYLNPPDKAVVMCVDEKSQIQAHQ